MRANIITDALYWATFNRFQMRLPGDAVRDLSAAGQVDAAAEYWAPIIEAQVKTDDFVNPPTPEKIREELGDYGAWEAEELTDEEMNWWRICWLAACSIAEDEEPDCSLPTHTYEPTD